MLADAKPWHFRPPSDIEAPKSLTKKAGAARGLAPKLGRGPKRSLIRSGASRLI